MAAKFETFNDKGGKYHFHLKAPNGEIIVASQGMTTKANAHKGIDAIKKHAVRRKGGRPHGITRSDDTYGHASNHSNGYRRPVRRHGGLASAPAIFNV